MFKKNSIQLTSERVILAPEGFVDSRYAPVLKDKQIRVIEIRSRGNASLFSFLRRLSTKD
jgi:hypothetical protein